MFGTGKTGFDLKTGQSYDIIENEKDLDMLVAMLSGNILGKQNTINYLREELKKAKDEAYASEEISKMKAELEEARADCRRGAFQSQKKSGSLLKIGKINMILRLMD